MTIDRPTTDIDDKMIEGDEGRRPPESGRLDDPTLVEDLLAIARRCRALPILDDRSEDEILGYDENGIPS